MCKCISVAIWAQATVRQVSQHMVTLHGDWKGSSKGFTGKGSQVGSLKGRGQDSSAQSNYQLNRQPAWQPNPAERKDFKKARNELEMKDIKK